MQIARFKSQNLHGYMNLNIFFNRDITFLTGANGSGKSSALYCAIALLNCDLQFLNDTDFESIEVQITQGRSKTNIRAERSERHIILKFGGESQFSFPKYIEDRTQPGFRLREAKSEYFSELLQLNAENPAIKGIIDVPSPLFLGIDRRTRTQNVSGVVQSGPSRKNIYNRRLSEIGQGSVDAAIDMAQQAYRDALIASGRDSESLRRDIIFELLTIRPKSLGALKAPTKGEIDDLARVLSDVSKFAKVLGLPETAIEKSVTPFLLDLQVAAEAITRSKKKSTEFDTKEVDALVKWSLNKDRYVQIKAIADLVDKFNESQRIHFSETDRFINLINAFLKNTRKELKFSERGYLELLVDSAKKVRVSNSLSSGEMQIFVILSHLIFNPDANEDNVFIIDEPELSLHLSWQEIFVDSLVDAAPNIQYVFATHSPTIIIGRKDRCVAVGPER